MELGLACPVCGQLNTIRATSCSRCGTVLAPVAEVQPVGMSSPPMSAPPRAAAPPGFGQAPMGYGQPPMAQPPMAQPPMAPPPMAQPPVTTPAQGFQPGRTVVSTNQPGSAPLRFDPNTGQPLGDEGRNAPKTMFFGALQQQAATPRLVVIKGEGGDGVTYHLSGTTHLVGRSKGDITFPEDVFLCHEHAKFTAQDGRLFVQDLSKTNGVFLRIKRPVLLDHGDMLLVGEQLLQIDSRPLPDYAANADGTYYYGSPRPESSFRLVQLLAGGGLGLVKSSVGHTLSIGREGNDLDFPEDRFISGHHAKLDLSDDAKVLLTDTGSRNGTFIRIKGAQELFHGDYLFVGQQLFRVEIS